MSRTEQEIDAAMLKLKATFRSGKTKTAEWRKHQLNQCIVGVEALKEEIKNAILADLGRNTFSSEFAEVSGVVGDCKWNLRKLDGFMKDEHVETEMLQYTTCAAKTLIRYEPLGVVGVYGAWNYPFNLTVGPMIQAIVAGNCCIVKPSEHSPATSAVIKKLCEVYMDQDSIRCCEGGIDTAVYLNNQKLDLICFTGSTFVGKIVAQTAAKNLIPCILELGGKCPTIIDQGCDMSNAVHKICGSKFQNSGQTCIAPDFILIHESLKQPFIDGCKALCKEVFPAEGSENQAKMVNDLHWNRMVKCIETSGGEVVYGGNKENHNQKLKHIEPTIIFNPKLDSELMTDEIFGPIMPIITFKHFDEVIEFVNDKPKPLALYYFGDKDHANAKRCVDETSSGAFMTNDCILHVLSHYSGFGGVGESGYGRYHGHEGFKQFSNRKGCLFKGHTAESNNKMSMPPFSD